MAKPNLLFVGHDSGCHVDEDRNMIYHGEVTGPLPTLLSFLSKKFSCSHIFHEDVTLERGQLKISGIASPHRFLDSCKVVLFHNYKWLPESERTRLGQIESFVAGQHNHLFMPNIVSDRDLFDQKHLFYSRIDDCAKILPVAAVVPRHVWVRESSDLARSERDLGYPFLLRVDGLSSGRGLFLIQDKKEAHRVYRLIRDGRPVSFSKFTKGILGAIRGFIPKGSSGPSGRVLAVEYFDSFHEELGAFLNGAAYFFGDNMFYAHPRLNKRNWNIHNSSAEDVDFPADLYRVAAGRFFAVLNQHIDQLKAIRGILGSAIVRLDLIVTNDDRLVVCEPALKNGVAKGAWNYILPALEQVGLSPDRVQEHIGAARISPDGILASYGLSRLVQRGDPPLP